jgi:hypothetical protein
LDGCKLCREAPNPAAATVLLADNTFASAGAVQLLVDLRRKQPLKVTARRNIFDSDHLVTLFGPLNPKKVETTRPEEMTDYLRSFVEWSDEANLYRRGCKYLVSILNTRSQAHSARIAGPDGWAKLWNQPPRRSVAGVIRFRERADASPKGPLRLDKVDDASGEVPEGVGADADRLGPGNAAPAAP